MKKLLVMALLTIMLTTVPVFAQTTPTQAYYSGSGAGTPPVIKAKWELPDEDPIKPWTQVNPPMSYQGNKTIDYWVIVTDYDGWNSVDAAYVDVYHPNNNCDPPGCDGSLCPSFKYQVKLTEIPICYPNGTIIQSNLDMVSANITAAHAAHLVTYGQNNTGYDFTLDEVKHELIKCSAKAFKGSQIIDYHQMCGEFTWEYQCTGTPPICNYTWTATDKTTGYKVNAYAYDTSGLKSPYLTNYFEYICQAGIEVDFNRLDFENVLYKEHKWIEGDNIFNTPTGPACRIGGGCRAPTIRNIGNIPVNITVMQDDMDFGYSGLITNPDWNVQWDARLEENAISIFNPYQTVMLDGTLGLCNTQEISFSIYVSKPVSTGQHDGTVTIETVKLPFPWWTCAR